MLENLLDVDRIPKELSEAILSKTEGNAFFLEEVLRSLIESGAIVFNNGRAVFQSEVGHLHVPDTVQGVLASRIDRLPAAEKTTLQTAAVLGREFDDLLLARVVPQSIPAAALSKCVNGLVRREFLRPHGFICLMQAREYIFKHALTQEVSYQTLLLAHRKELLRRAGEALEALWPEKLDECAGVLGQHFAKAELPEMVVGSAIEESRPVMLFGPGERKHSFIAVADVAAFAIAATQNPAAGNQKLALGGPDAISWREIVAIAEQVLGRAIPIQTVKPMDVPQLPELIVALLSGMEMADVIIPMEETAREFGAQQTSARQFIGRIFLPGTGC